MLACTVSAGCEAVVLDVGTRSDELASTGATSSGEDTMDGASLGADTTAGEPVECAASPDPVDVACGSDCSRCIDGACGHDCVGADACAAETITCEDGRPCEVICMGGGACREATIECPAAHACTIECTAASACVGLQVRCGDGPCTVQCQANDACEGLVLQCGAGDGAVACNGPRGVEVMPAAASSCACAAQGCG